MSDTKDKAACIGVDWGTSSFRAWLFDQTGTVLDSVRGPFGITQAKDATFEQTLRRAVGSWLVAPADIPVIMCGMIGSAQGWHEAGYLSGRVGVNALAAGAVRIAEADLKIYIIPGIKGVSADGHNDVVRGEETLLADWLARSDGERSVFCLPGTHSKWMVVGDGKIDQLTTFMTGELFELMRTQSILSPLIAPDCVVDCAAHAFEAGLKLAQTPSGLLHQMFAVRAGILTGHFKQADALTLLSAVLVGGECVAASAANAGGGLPPVTLLSSGALQQTYQTAFEILDIPYKKSDSEKAAQAGLFSVFQHLAIR